MFGRTQAKVISHAADGALQELYLHARIPRQLLRMAQHHLAVVYANGSLCALPRCLYAMPRRPAPARRSWQSMCRAYRSCIVHV